MDRRKEKDFLDNQKIGEYLEFYVKRSDEPGFAVFLNGEWGSGKTWFIEKFRKDHKELKFLYVSLYGVSSLSEIDDLFFQQLHPLLASKAFTLGAKILKGALKGALKVDLGTQGVGEIKAELPNDDIKKFLTNSEDRILIFDDLERCKIVEEALGYINHFVEHQGQRVILLGHEKEVPDFEKYQKKNEKLIGRRFTVHAELKEALHTFVGAVKDGVAKEILSKNSDLILEVFDRTDHKNLRTLKYGVIEFERFLAQLPEGARKNEQFASACVNTFFSLCIELRSGSMTPHSIQKLTSHYTSYLADKSVKKGDKNEPDILAKIYERHFGASTLEMIPNEESLYFFFEYGFIPPPVVDDAIASCSLFAQDNTPTWMKLWRLYSLSDEEFTKYCAEVLGEFQKNKFTKQGEIRHVAGLILFLATKGMIDLTPARATEMVTNVVNKMVSENLVDFEDEDENRFPRFDDVYAGLQFQSISDETFKKISETLRSYQQRRREENVKSSAGGLIEIMKSDPTKLYRMLTVSNTEDETFAGLPILQYINAEDFLTALREMEPGRRLDIGHIFKKRYSMVRAFPALYQELDWLKKLNDAITRALDGLKQPTKHTFELLTTDFLSPVIKGLEEWKKAEAGTPATS